MEGQRDEVAGVGEPSSVAAGGELNPTAATTESLLSMANLDWGKAACSYESVEKWTAADVFHPGMLVEWRVPAKDEAPSPSTMDDQFVILSLTHIMCGLRLDASDFLVSVLTHYGIEWSHLTPRSYTVLSIFAHLCEFFLCVPPTVELFAHFYRLYPNNRGETTILGGAYFRLRDNMKKNYPVYYFRGSQIGWSCLWFYAKLLKSCRLTFKGDALEEANNWNDVLPLSAEQEKQVLRIMELSNQGLTGVDIVRNYLKHRISPLRRRAHLACNYTGPTDPTRDSDKDLSEEDIENMLDFLLYLRKIGQKVTGTSADEEANQPLKDPPRRYTRQSVVPRKKVVVPPTPEIDSSRVRGQARIAITTAASPKQGVEHKSIQNPAEIQGRERVELMKPISSIIGGKRLFPRQSVVPRKKIVVPPPPEIDSSRVRGQARIAITTAASPNQGVEHKSIQNPAEIQGRERVELMKPISSIIGGKRKFYASPSDSQIKAKYSLISTLSRTRMSCLDTGCIKGNSLRKEAAVALNRQSRGSARPSPASSVQKGEKNALFILANVVDQNKVAEDSMSNVLLDRHVRDSPPKEIDPAQSIAEGVQDQEAIQESGPITVLNPEEINSEAIWERMQKVKSDYVYSSQTTLSELLEQANKLVLANKRMKDAHIMLKQQMKDLEENRRLLTDTMRKAELEELKRIEDNTKLKDDIRDQKKLISMLTEQNESTQRSLVQKCTEVSRLEEEAAVLIKDKKELQSRVTRADELRKLMMSALCHGKGEENRLPDFLL